MKKVLSIILVFSILFLIVIIVNESSRHFVNSEGYSVNGIKTINPKTQTVTTCSWNCYKNTAYCKANHVKILKPLFLQLDPFYFKIISLLKSTGSYAYANIIFLVLLWPLFIVFLFITILKNNSKIKSLKSYGIS